MLGILCIIGYAHIAKCPDPDKLVKCVSPINCMLLPERFCVMADSHTIKMTVRMLEITLKYLHFYNLS